MANKSNEVLNWQEVDPATLSGDAQEAWATYKEAYAAASELRKAFEQVIEDEAELPKGYRMVFGYNFGKLSMAVGKAKPKNTTGSKAVSFADLIAKKA